MEEKLILMVRKLRKENSERSVSMRRGILSDYNHTVTVHLYNHTLDIIKQIEDIIGKVSQTKQHD